ncbi:hypothetical protein [Methanosarcina horonobensis]|uniref:hypothetical protein n=1 Tax=Methanosarcina horonobensis TaxID=418008 RepID=UPI00064ED8C7|nr:hypothetical protein [Methanosarcina horonobensis]
MSGRIERGQFIKTRGETGRNRMINAKTIAREPEIIWNLDINKDGKSYQENYMLLFPRYVSAIDEE